LLGFRVWSLIIGSILQNFFFMVLIFYYRPWWPRPVFKLKTIQKMLSFGISVNTSKIFTYLTDNSDNLIIGKVLGEKALGFYNRAFTLGTMPIQKSSTIIYRISFPVFSQLQDDRVMLREYFLKINKYISLLAFPAMIGLFLISDNFVRVVLGERWMPIILPLKILCGVGIMKSMFITLPPLLYSKGKANIMLKYSFLCGLIMPLAFYAGAKFGINGVAIAWVIVYPFMFFYLLRLVLREINLSIYDYIANISHTLMGTVFIAAMVVIFQYSASANGYVQLIGSCLAGLLSYSIFLIFVSKETVSEFKNILYSLRTRKIQT
jgi:O-antigen/teichoic acid export membrane protein